MIKVPVNICRRLLSPENEICNLIGRKYRFENTIGMNGRIWIKSKSIQTTSIIMNILKHLEFIPVKDQDRVINEMLS